MAPEVIFCCGQCFRFFKEGEDYVGVAHGRVIRVEKREHGMILHNAEAEDAALWREYFDLGRSYHAIESAFMQDAVLRKTIPAARGMRLLNQDPFETIITFIISANNNVGRIQKIVERICACCGKEIIYKGRKYHAFPEPEALAGLSEEKLRELGAGYRAPYLAETARRIAEGYDIHQFYEMDYDAAKKELCTLKGVGTKVADCILLFAYQKKNAFPLDVWIKRMLGELYGFVPKNSEDAVKFAEKTFGKNAGIAQQYLFHYMRSGR